MDPQPHNLDQGTESTHYVHFSQIHRLQCNVIVTSQQLWCMKLF